MTATHWQRCDVMLEMDYRRMHDVMPLVRYPILAEGDSWFSTNGTAGDNLLKALSTRSSSLILSFANPGDEMRRMRWTNALGGGHFMQLLMREPQKFWRALLLSGGGNDLIADIDKIIKPVSATADPRLPASYVRESALTDTLRDIEKGMRALAAMRDGTAHHNMPIIIHTYDLPMPRHAPGSFLGISTGPWLKPRLEAAGVPDGMQPLVVDFLFSRLSSRLAALETGTGVAPIRGLRVCKTHGALRPADPAANGCSNDWLDEIHPTRFGYQKIAETRLNPFLDKALNASWQ